MFSKFDKSGTCREGFLPVAANSNTRMFFTDEEEHEVHAHVEKLGGITQRVQIGDIDRIDIFMTDKDKAMGMPNMSVSRYPTIYSLYVRSTGLDLQYSVLSSTLAIMGHFANIGPERSPRKIALD